MTVAGRVHVHTTDLLCDVDLLSNALFRAVIEGTTDPIFVKDCAGRYLMLNAAAAERLNAPAAGIIGRTNLELLEGPNARRLAEPEERVIRTGVAETYEDSGPDRGDQRQFLITEFPFRNPAGQIIGVIGMARDITQVKELETQLRQAQKMEAIGRLAGGIAHDFNNLLTVILGATESLLETVDAAEQRAAVSDIECAASRAAELTQQLLAFGRRQILQPRTVALNDLVAPMERLVARIIGEDVALRVDLGEARCVRVDPNQFSQVFMNLIVNARDAMPNGGTITIRTGSTELSPPDRWHAGVRVAPGRYARLTIADTGCGMDAAVLSRIFEPFFTTKQGYGTGLGLATAHGVIEQSGGYVWADSNEGQGTVFTIMLPQVDGPAEAHEVPGAHNGRQTGNERILLVEDEAAVRKLLTRVLEQYGYHVTSAADPAEAIDAARQTRFDLLVTDVVLRTGRGPALAQELRALDPQLKVLLISGYCETTVNRQDPLPNSHFLQKPFTPPTLAAKVRDVLAAGGHA